MKIDKVTNLAKFAGIEASEPRKAKSEAADKPAAGTQASISSVPVAGDIDQAKVDRVVAAIKAGELEFDPEKIADGLIQAARAFAE